jgi:uncharacterized cupredoxin-like copper-binding protein
MTKNRVATLLLVATAAVLVWALPAGANGSGGTVSVTLGKPSEFHITVKGAPTAGAVTFKVTNQGALPHDFKIGGKKTPILQNGQSKTLTVSLKKGKSAYLCTVSGHAAAGMKGTLTVK